VTHLACLYGRFHFGLMWLLVDCGFHFLSGFYFLVCLLFSIFCGFYFLVDCGFYFIFSESRLKVWLSSVTQKTESHNRPKATVRSQ